MSHKPHIDIEELLLEAHRKGVEHAIELSIRTGVPLIIQENGVIKEIMYDRVPTIAKTVKRKSPKSK